jgi:hypothetical protein
VCDLKRMQRVRTRTEWPRDAATNKQTKQKKRTKENKIRIVSANTSRRSA